MAQESARGADRKWLVGATLCLLGFLILTAAVVAQCFETLDADARVVVQHARLPALHSVMTGASLVGGLPGQVALVVVASVVLWPRRRQWAIGLPCAMAGAGLVQLLAKWSLGRPRPNLTAWGFPSAHVLSLVVLCGYLVYVISLMSARGGWGHVSAGAGVGVVGLVAYSRMYLDVHWLSDILGGLLGGLACLLGALWIVQVAPRLGDALRAIPLMSAAKPRLPITTAGPVADPLVDVAAAVAMAPTMPTASAG
jgi:membrane-associated phospholipid phosphatase